MPHAQLDAAKLKTLPLSQRRSYIDIEKQAINPDAPPPDAGSLSPQLRQLAKRIVAARQHGAAVMLTYGAHLIKNGAAPLVNRLMRDGWVTHVATQGGGVIHDWEFAYLGRSSESVRNNAPVGRFGSWDETGRWINLAVVSGSAQGLGFGEALGRFVVENGLELPPPQQLQKQIADEPKHPLTGARADLLQIMDRLDLEAGRVNVEHPYQRYTILACAYKCGVPLTVHPGIGYDIITNHPMFHGAAIGRASATDVRIFAQAAKNLTDGVYVSIGSAIMSPQVFEKAFSAANNVLEVEGRPFIADHYLAIVDLQDGGDWDWTKGEPPQDHPAYYLRFCKTFYRMGGTLDYLRGDNCVVLANLVALLAEKGQL